MRKLVLILSLLIAWLWPKAQTYNFDTYTVEEGLVINTVLCVYQDSKGFIWIGTNGGGISIFDGKNFKSITEKNGLASNVVYSISEDQAGSYYVATKEGLTIISKGKYTTYTKENGLSHNLIFNVKHTKNHGVILATPTGINVFKGDTIVRLPGDTNLAKQATFNIFEDSKGDIWFGTLRKGAYRYNGGLAENFNVDKGLLHSFVYTIVEDNDHNIYFGTAAGINRLNRDQTIEEIRPHVNTVSHTIQSSVKDKDGNIWFGTKTGLLKFDGKNFKVFRDENGLPISDVFTVNTDREGNIWAGTNGKGLAKFNRNGEVFTNYSVKDGISNDIVTAIFEDSRGTIWVGSDEGITRMDSNQFYVYNKKEITKGHFLGLGPKTYDIKEDKDGNVWFATHVQTEAVLKYDPRSKDSYDIKSIKSYFLDNSFSASTSMTQSILMDGNITYFGTVSGVVKYQDGKFEPFLQGDVKDRVWFIAKTKDGHLWFATENGAVMYDGSSVEYFNETHGFVKGRVRTVVEDHDGMLWFATEEGVYRYNYKGFNNITTQQGLSADNIFSLLIDKNGFLWVGTARGIQKLDVKKYNQTGDISIKKYGKLEGFIGLECNMNAAFEDKEGKLWFGTVKGVTVLDPSLEVVNNLEPQTHITNIRLDFENYDFSAYSDSMNYKTGLPDGLVLPYTKNHLTFDFIGNSFTASQKVRYQYMLEGLDRDWLMRTDKTEAVYPHIPAGTYTFKVKAMNNDEVWNEEPVSFTFTILPPWYLTWWAILIYAAIAFSGFYAYTVYRTAALKKQKEILETQVAERTAEVVKEKEKVEAVNKQVLHQNEIIEEKNKEITDSINYAKGIQDAILPHIDKVKENLPNSFILFRPKDIVSGDFYWMEEKDGTIYFTAADCTGHGVPGAFVSMVGVNGLNRSVNGYALRKPSDILNKLRDLVEETFKKRKDGMDISLCALDVKTKELQWAGANNPLWIIRKKGQKPLEVDGQPIEPNIDDEICELYELKADKQPVGAFDAAEPFTNHTVKLEEGDSIYVFSDGYPDQFGGPKGKKFMSKSLKKLLISLYEKDMETQQQVLNKNIEDWMEEGEIEQIDDICVFGVRI